MELGSASELPEELRERCLRSMLDLQKEIRSASEWRREISAELRPSPLSMRYIKEIRSAVNQEVSTSKHKLVSCAVWRRYSLSAALVMIFLLALLSGLMLPESKPKTGFQSEVEGYVETEIAEHNPLMNRSSQGVSCDCESPSPPPFMVPPPPRDSVQHHIFCPVPDVPVEAPSVEDEENTSCDWLYREDVRIEAEDDLLIWLPVPNRFHLDRNEDVI